MQYAAFLRFTLAGTSYAWGSTEAYRSGQWHDGKLASFPSPTESWNDAYGLLQTQQFDVDVAFSALSEIPALGENLDAILDEAGGTLLDEAGGTVYAETGAYLAGTDAVLELVRTDATEHAYTKTVTITGYRLRPGMLTLTLSDIESTRLDATYPSRTFTTADWPELFTEHVGRPVPFATGTAVKVPLALIRTGGGGGPWVYAACESTATVLAVYRSGRIVSSSAYTTGTLAAPSGYTIVTLSFASEQTDPSGGHYEMSADMSGPSSRNAATELSRVLTLAGLTPDSTSISAAETAATAAAMTVDCRYVEPRSFRYIVNDLALVLRGHIYRLAGGSIGIAQDVAGASALSLDEVAGDLLAVSEMSCPAQPATIELSYKPSPRDPSQLLHTLSRPGGGLSGVTRYEAPYVSDHTAADRLACYLSRRAQKGARIQAAVYAEDLALGDILTLTQPYFWSGAKDWRIAKISHPALGADMELIEYDATIYDYLPGSLPADAVTGYQPDYSLTPPAAPADLVIVSSGAVVSTTGHVDAWVKLRATPPAANYEQVWFAAENDDTEEVYQAQGTDNGNGTWGATIPGLRPAQAHHVKAWAINANGMLGEDTTPLAHTSATDAGVPAVPAGLNAYQATGKSARILWAKVADADLAYYELQMSSGAAYTTIQTTPATSYVHAGLSYGTTYSYQVRAVDRAGNASDYCTPVSVTPAANVNTPDVVDSAITTAKRQAINVSTTSTSLAAGAHGFWQFTHNLGRDVVVTPYSGNGAVMVWVVPIDTNSFYVHGYNWGASQNPLTIGAWYW